MTPDQITDFWFRDDINDAAAMRARIDTLFSVDVGFDAEVCARLGKAVERAFAGTLDHWAAEPRGALALVILLDQAPRNIYRGTACAFAGDVRARAITEAALTYGFEAKLALIECVFLYLPFEHAEDLTLQNRCVSGYEAVVCAGSEGFSGSHGGGRSGRQRPPRGYSPVRPFSASQCPARPHLDTG